MTETPEQTIEPTTDSHAVAPRAAAPPQRWRGRGDHRRVYRIAAAAVTLAATVFVIAVIFWSGFILGAHAGGGHQWHGGGGGHSAAMMHHGHGGQGSGQGG
jgi:hypothetical protein